MTREGHVLNTDKYYWVMAETIGASALLAKEKKDIYYYNVYNWIFEYSWIFFVDKKYGGWYQKLNRSNEKYSNVKSPPPKTDYHPIANCFEAIRAFTY